MKHLCLLLIVLVLLFNQTPTVQATAHHKPEGTQTNSDSIYTSLLLFNIGSAKSFQDCLSSLITLGLTTGYTEELFTANESPDVAPASYLLDKSKTYTWTSYYDGQITLSTATYSNEIYEEQPEWDLWKEITNGETEYFLVKETEDGLYTGYPYSEYYSDLRYPIFEGKSWDTSDEEMDFNTHTVIAIDRTVTVKAGTFNDVIQVDTSNGWTFYYAPNIGAIKSEHNGVIMTELSELSD